jgi:hypothetical protein
MKCRKLRIAWSVAWGVPCALLMILFVRSQFIEDSVFWPGTNRAVYFHSVFGHMRVSISTGPPSRPFNYVHDWTGPTRGGYVRGSLGFYYQQDVNGVRFDAPFWPFWLICGAMAAVPWVSRILWSNRFSLRAILIITTLVGVALTLFVWATK